MGGQLYRCRTALSHLIDANAEHCAALLAPSFLSGNLGRGATRPWRPPNASPAEGRALADARYSVEHVIACEDAIRTKGERRGTWQ